MQRLGDIAVGGVVVGVVIMGVSILAVIAFWVGVATGVVEFSMPIPGE